MSIAKVLQFPRVDPGQQLSTTQLLPPGGRGREWEQRKWGNAWVEIKTVS